MSIATEITRLQGAKDALKTAIEGKGVQVPSSALIDAYPALVDQIQQGGGSTEAEKKDVNFYDFTGVRLYSYTLEEAQSLPALPPAPDHSGHIVPLTFQGWNWDLESINALQTPMEIGAVYVPTDERDHIVVEISEGDSKEMRLLVRRSVGTGTIDWGDGTTSTIPTSDVITSHTYASAGTYDIVLTHSSRITLGSGYNNIFAYGETESKAVTTLAELSMVRYIHLGSTDVTLEGRPLGFLPDSFRGVTMAEGRTSIPNYFAQGAALPMFVFPKSLTSISSYAFRNSKLRRISLSQATKFATHAFTGAYFLERLCIPSVGMQTIAITLALASADVIVFPVCNAALNATDSVFVRKIYVPEGCTGSFKMQSCGEVVEMVLPSTITSIVGQAFESCRAMTALYIKAVTPPTLANTNAFNSISGLLKIYVPRESVDTYKAATNWSSRASMIEGYDF